MKQNFIRLPLILSLCFFQLISFKTLAEETKAQSAEVSPWSISLLLGLGPNRFQASLESQKDIYGAVTTVAGTAAAGLELGYHLTAKHRLGIGVQLGFSDGDSVEHTARGIEDKGFVTGIDHTDYKFFYHYVANPHNDLYVYVGPNIGLAHQKLVRDMPLDINHFKGSSAYGLNIGVNSGVYWAFSKFILGLDMKYQIYALEGKDEYRGLTVRWGARQVALFNLLLGVRF